MIFFIQIQIHDRFVTVIKVGTKPRKEMMAKDNKMKDFGGNFLGFFFAFSTPIFCSDWLVASASWLAISNQLQRWMTSAAFQRLSMTQRKTL